ncbi:hypothetical protein E2C01_095130 [Portunus trituberculatus]|uniref:Uncharacterized protein n=1 Tax=Portunus trituberculatus TaxID=210409 RepID=A0A5B7JP16_PORTR|nr:hypothetical protein [Portunus trituberculatus]
MQAGTVWSQSMADGEDVVRMAAVGDVGTMSVPARSLICASLDLSPTAGSFASIPEDVGREGGATPKKLALGLPSVSSGDVISPGRSTRCLVFAGPLHRHLPGLRLSIGCRLSPSQHHISQSNGGMKKLG